MEYRPCRIERKVFKKKDFASNHAIFHEWTTNVIGTNEKIIEQILAIVEFEDGHVELVKPSSIIFLDSKKLFNQFDFEEHKKAEEQMDPEYFFDRRIDNG